MEKEIFFTAISKMGVMYTPGKTETRLTENSVRLELSKNLKPEVFLLEDGLPNQNGMRPMQAALIQGLLTNIKIADKNGWWNEADHLRWVIDELQRAFVSVHYSEPNIQKDYM